MLDRNATVVDFEKSKCGF